MRACVKGGVNGEIRTYDTADVVARASVAKMEQKSVERQIAAVRASTVHCEAGKQ